MNNTIDPIYIVEIGEGLDQVAYTPNMTLGGVLSGRKSTKDVTIKVNNLTKSNDYVLQPGDRIDLTPNYEAGTND